MGYALLLETRRFVYLCMLQCIQLIKKRSEHPPWVALSRARDHIPSFPRKRESSGRGLNLRDGTQRFQTASKEFLQ